jgi:hypothetical protein
MDYKRNPPNFLLVPYLECEICKFNECDVDFEDSLVTYPVFLWLMNFSPAYSANHFWREDVNLKKSCKLQHRLFRREFQTTCLRHAVGVELCLGRLERPG